LTSDLSLFRRRYAKLTRGVDFEWTKKNDVFRGRGRVGKGRKKMLVKGGGGKKLIVAEGKGGGDNLYAPRIVRIGRGRTYYTIEINARGQAGAMGE